MFLLNEYGFAKRLNSTHSLNLHGERFPPVAFTGKLDS